MERIKITHARILTPFREIPEGCLLIEGETILDVLEVPDVQGDFKEICASGAFVSPGWMDLHVHGGGGHDFMDGTSDAFLGVAQAHVQHGTTAFVPTTLTCTPTAFTAVCTAYEAVKQRRDMPVRMLGMHLEGPYFAESQKGAQDARFLRCPCLDEYEAMLRACPDMTRWSIAPELPGALTLGRALFQRGILASVAHSDATAQDMVLAHEAGYRHVTHLYSAMSGVRRVEGRRVGGVIEAAYLDEDMTVELIADGFHLPAELLRLAVGIKGPSRVALVTDAMRGAGMPEGDSILGGQEDGQKVLVEGGVAWLPDKSAFAGSVATADVLIRNMVSLARVPLLDAVRMMTATPARIMGVEREMGVLSPGMAADVVVFDPDIHVGMTMVRGRIVHDRLTEVATR